MTMAMTRGGGFPDLVIHEAAHAVVAWELGARIGQLRIDRARGTGQMRFMSDGAIGRFARDSEAHRAAAERDMLIYHAGFVAQRRFHIAGTRGIYPLYDYAAVLTIAQEFSSYAALIDAWSTYMEDQARKMIEHPATWTRIRAFALELARRATRDGTTVVDGEAAERFIAGVRVPPTNAFLAYRRREATGTLVVLDDERTRQRFRDAVDRVCRGRPA